MELWVRPLADGSEGAVRIPVVRRWSGCLEDHRETLVRPVELRPSLDGFGHLHSGRGWSLMSARSSESNLSKVQPARRPTRVTDNLPPKGGWRGRRTSADPVARQRVHNVHERVAVWSADPAQERSIAARRAVPSTSYLPLMNASCRCSRAARSGCSAPWLAPVGLDQEATGAASRTHDRVGRLRSRAVDHRADCALRKPTPSVPGCPASSSSMCRSVTSSSSPWPWPSPSPSVSSSRRQEQLVEQPACVTHWRQAGDGGSESADDACSHFVAK